MLTLTDGSGLQLCPLPDFLHLLITHAPRDTGHLQVLVLPHRHLVGQRLDKHRATTLVAMATDHLEGVTLEGLDLLRKFLDEAWLDTPTTWGGEGMTKIENG